MSKPSARLAQSFTNIGHAYSHILTILYPTVVLALERGWGLSYGELIALMLAGQILFGAAALPAGWLGDRWSTLGMMVVFFLGSGLAAVLTGFARNPLEIALGLALIGLFAAIYHPVGMAWLVRTAVNRGRALGANGVYGAVGLAIGPLIAGALTDLISWRAAFIVPGATCAALGVALLAAWRLGFVADTHADLKPHPEPERGHVVRAFFLQTPVLFIAAALDSWPLLFVSVSMVFINVAALPAENGLLARYTPGKWRATAYGAKFVLALGVSASSIPLIAYIHDATGGFYWLFVLLGGLAAIVFLAALLLPSERPTRAAVAASAAE